MMDEQFLRNPKVSKLIKELRGGSLTEAAIAVVVIIFIWQIMGVGIEGFQVPIVYPNGARVRPANGGIQGQLHHPKGGGRITVRMSNSNQCPANAMQVSGFVKNGRLDLREAFNEVQRRASEIGCDNFECSFERFRALATEGKLPTENSVREAISALQGEMLGY
jgi:hypothetical protein